MINRRQFALASTAGLAAATAHLDRFAVAEVPSLSEKRLVEQGLNALSRAHERSYFANGHRGASMISAHLMCVDNQLGDATTNRIIELFDLNWASSPLCAAYPESDPIDDAVKRVGETLAKGGTVLREVGHDVIFAMHAIKAFRMVPALATEERVTGVCDLIDQIKPWRDIDPSEDVSPPPFSDSKAASKFILKEASHSIDRFQGFGQGFAGHMLTFGQALVELAAMGDVEWAESCRTAFRKYVTVTRKGPQPGDRKIKDHSPSQLRPDESKYWQQRGDKSLGIGHVFKYPYAYYDLLARAEDAELEKELDSKAWQIF
ncbi:hypothetical protein FF011L_33700 [Roseimaritima multifibrata]|uniref:Uncharacterized protein n=1 Tax=Roseimaritima multifibrata TaxID=1930274 RepID=A0A517MI83_9BACT|nr:hypothetical protein [Roseimaritima multifibrata]QDS94591.1 hypothetical protein FF011L_33700 [Roseimaritima multifibrata]